MRIRQYDGFWQVTWLPTVFPVNVYLVEEPDGLTLIDTGLPVMATGILRAARRIGQPIRRIALTHSHLDHAGGLDRLKDTLPDVIVVCSTREAPLLAGDLSLQTDEPPAVGGVLPGHWARAHTSPDRLLADGDSLGSLTAVATPGHTPGHLAYYHEPSGAVFTGDAYQVRGGLAVAGQHRPLFPFVARATWNPTLALASGRRLASLPVRYLASAHGDVLDDPVQAMLVTARLKSEHGHPNRCHYHYTLGRADPPGRRIRT